MGRIFFTSDTHFGHKNVISHSNRPFENAHHMNVTMTENWNRIVSPKDTVYHLGDFVWSGQDQFKSIVSKLNGNIKLVFGNHDKNARAINKQVGRQFGNVEFLGDYHEVEIDGTLFVLMHYPLKCWDKMRYGSVHLFGHCHGNLLDDPTIFSYDVGVDVNDYKPISIETALLNMAKKTPMLGGNHIENKFKHLLAE